MKKKILSKILMFVVTITLILSVSFVLPKSKAATWYTPDLSDYTFMIPYDDGSLLFKSNDLVSGDFYAYLIRDYDFGVSQTLTGALDFTEIHNTLDWVGFQSLYGSRYGLTPMFFYNSLPSYVTYNIYNDFSPLENKGAVNLHTIIYRLDFMGDYAMRLDGVVYDYVYTFEVIYHIRINYTSNNYVFNRGYLINYFSRAHMREFSLYVEMDSDLIQFELFSDYEANYTRGYADGYDDGYNDGYEVGYDDGILVDESEAYEEGFRDGQKSKLAENNEAFYKGIEKWLVPAVITVIVLGGFVTIAVRKRREE